VRLPFYIDAKILKQGLFMIDFSCNYDLNLVNALVDTEIILFVSAILSRYGFYQLFFIKLFYKWCKGKSNFANTRTNQHSSETL
jgi:hypothetical protein